MDDNRADVFCNGVTTVPEGNNGTSEGAMVSWSTGGVSRSTSPKRKSSPAGKLVDRSSYCPGDRAFVNSVTLVGIEICTRPFREAIDISLSLYRRS